MFYSEEVLLIICCQNSYYINRLYELYRNLFVCICMCICACVCVKCAKDFQRSVQLFTVLLMDTVFSLLLLSMACLVKLLSTTRLLIIQFLLQSGTYYGVGLGVHSSRH